MIIVAERTQRYEVAVDELERDFADERQEHESLHAFIEEAAVETQFDTKYFSLINDDVEVW